MLKTNNDAAIYVGAEVLRGKCEKKSWYLYHRWIKRKALKKISSWENLFFFKLFLNHKNIYKMDHQIISSLASQGFHISVSPQSENNETKSIYFEA